eukprot:gene2803-16239_t
MWHLSEYPQEREILLPPFTQWEVVSVANNEAGITVVTLDYKNTLFRSEPKLQEFVAATARDLSAAKNGGVTATGRRERRSHGDTLRPAPTLKVAERKLETHVDPA